MVSKTVNGVLIVLYLITLWLLINNQHGLAMYLMTFGMLFAALVGYLKKGKE